MKYCKLFLLYIMAMSSVSLRATNDSTKLLCETSFSNRFLYANRVAVDEWNTQRKILFLQNVLFGSGGDIVANAVNVNLRTLTRWKEASESSAPRAKHIGLINVFMKHVMFNQAFVDPSLAQTDLTRMMDTYLTWRKKYEAKRQSLLDRLLVPSFSPLNDIEKILLALLEANSKVRQNIFDIIKHSTDEALLRAFDKNNLYFKFIEGIDAFNMASYHQAISLFEGILADQPTETLKELTTFHLAACYTRIGSFQKAYALTDTQLFPTSLPMTYSRLSIASIERNPGKIDLYFEKWKAALTGDASIESYEQSSEMEKVFWEDPDMQFARLYLFVRGRINSSHTWGERPVQSNDEIILRKLYGTP